jgi:7,8-dihydro-6-hydroxymethylpterin dimethyltransferase
MSTQQPGDTQLVAEPQAARKKDADYVFYELTRSICPQCRRVIDAQVVLRDNKVYMRKRCPDCGPFEALIYADAEAYTTFGKYNKPGTIPLAHGSEISNGCPYDCGLCPDHQQHTCLGIIEVNSNCNMNCPLCFSNAHPGFSLTLEEVEQMLDDLVRTEGNPEVVQFSGGEPTIHPQIIDFVQAAQARGIPFVMINTNGKRIARDDRFLEQLNHVRPSLYFQFDGFESETYRILRGEPDILEEKLRALDRLAEIGLNVTPPLNGKSTNMRSERSLSSRLSIPPSAGLIFNQHSTPAGTHSMTR